MLRLSYLFCGLLMTSSLIAQIKELPINNPESVVSFSVGFAGGITSIDGRFNKFSGRIGYNIPGEISSLYADISIKVESINTGDKERDADLMGEEFFHQDQYPEITFKSKSVQKEGEAYVMLGDFTMMGKTIELEVPFERSHPEALAWVFGEPRIAVKGETIINRLEFGIPKRGWNNFLPSLGSMTLSKEVKVKLSIMGMGEGVSTLMLKAAQEEGSQKAIGVYNKLKKAYGDQPNTYVFGGRGLAGVTFQLARGELVDDAIAIGLFAVKEDPESFLVHYALAGAYEAKGDKSKARTHYEKTIELNPNFERAKSALLRVK